MEERNQRPEEGSKLPVVALAVLVFVIAALLYVGYEYASDTSSSTQELTNVNQDPTMTTKTTDDVEQPVEPAPAKLEKRDIYVPPANVSDDDETRNSESEAEEEAPKKVAEKPKPAPSEKAPEPPKPEPVKPEPAPKAEESKPEATAAKVPSGGTTVTLTVDNGQTFYGIASRYNVKWETLKKLNPDVDDSKIKVGVTKLRIPVRAIHTVGPGDIMRVVAQKYGISVDQLMAANNKTKNRTDRGEKLIIPYSTKE
ncbi:MAG: LysM peptidoglycan-binding domain-containing protein [Sphingobacteriaceae bacterium]|nr:LysM peptidoglycan-binding domain-containing protein [Cytophagaceae bacterium]